MAGVGPELVIGIVSPLGISNRITAGALSAALDTVGYDTRPVEAIELVYDLFQEEQPLLPRHALYEARMSKGNQFRRLLGRNDAVARCTKIQHRPGCPRRACPD